MSTFPIYENHNTACIIIEEDAYEGVKRIGKRAAEDILLVTGDEPPVIREKKQCKNALAIVAATLGRSHILEELEAAGKWKADGITGKREVYQIQVIENPFPDMAEIKKALVIAGSDKRGTIYGMFHLSEMCGVSPLLYWGDVTPEKKGTIVLEIGERLCSKEPSVKYRGFFINDEWPAFGNWCMETFGGVNAKAYEEIFILLLRMKGNYLWPAMWNSIFSEEGPGIESARLADCYGIVMGASHHEPMCRAGAEWQRIYQNYGKDNTWSFVTNKEAITEFWKDGILRNKPFENVITIGMRGENDSMLLSKEATLADNIQVIKDAILTQHELIRTHINEDLSQVPRMLAIYKEVEDYYYGDDICEGLKDWKELNDVILLLCEDNYGNTRGLPDIGKGVHPGGYGMYYHFDYHGAPISYEWQNSSRLTKTWEQMTMAYEYGVRELWIVNVGDLKGAEYPLSFFMDLAYDYETYSKPNQTEEYAKRWIDIQFGERLNRQQKEDMFELLEGYTKWNSIRRPEAMSSHVYHPCHFREGDRVWEEVNALMKKADKLKEEMPKECLDAYCSMIYYPAAASMNLILMHIEAGWNAHFAKRGAMSANVCGASVKRRILQDRKYVEAYHKIADGKWNHMMDSAHTGFRSWDDSDWSYPTVQEVLPIPKGKIVTGFRGSEAFHLGEHWQDDKWICNDDFTRPDAKEVLIDLDSRGDVDFTYRIECDKLWVDFSPKEGKVHSLEEGGTSITVTCDRTRLSGRERAYIRIFVEFDNGEKTVGKLALDAEQAEYPYPAGTYVEHQGYIAMRAENFVEEKKVDEKGFEVIEHLGRTGPAVKAFPATEFWADKQEAPYLKYAFAANQGGEYILRLCLLPRNPVEKGARLRCVVSVNDGERKTVDTVPDSFTTDWGCGEWCKGVLDNIRLIETVVTVQKGENHLYFYAADPGIVLDGIVLYPNGTELPDSYLGPIESYRI